MTDTTEQPEPIYEPCRDHKEAGKPFDASCEECRKLNELHKGPREKANAVLTLERFEETAHATGTALSELSSRYSELCEFAWIRQMFGSGGRGSADGSERDVAGLLSANAPIRAPLAEAGRLLHHAHASLNTGLYALDLVVKAIEKAHPDSFDPTEQQLRLHEKPATRSQLAETKRARAREMRREADDLDKQARSLEQKIRVDTQRAAEIKARREGKPAPSKSQRRRARRSGNGFNAPVVEPPKPEPTIEHRPDWHDRQLARGYLPPFNAEDQIEAERRRGNLPQTDQKERTGGAS